MITVTVKPAKRFLGRKQWRFVVQAGNGEIIAVSERYNNLEDAKRTARLLSPEVRVVE